MLSVSQCKSRALEWTKSYLLNEKTPPPWLCGLIILTLELQSRAIISELSIFALLTALVFRYNILFLIPFDPTAGCLPITSVIFAASLLSCNYQWKQYMRVFSLLIYYAEGPEIKSAVAVASSIFLAELIFQKLELNNAKDNIEGFQISFGVAVTFSVMTMADWLGFENKPGLILGCFIFSIIAARIIIVQRIEYIKKNAIVKIKDSNVFLIALLLLESEVKEIETGSIHLKLHRSEC
jgi:hypothetical protein